MNKIDIHLPILIKNKREKKQITNIRNEREDFTTEPTEIKRMIGNIINNFMGILRFCRSLKLCLLCQD